MPTPNMYDDSDATPPESASPPQPTDKAPDEKEGKDESATAELPKAVLGGKDFKPGEEVTLKVVQVMEDSVLVSYASGEEEREEEPPAAEPPAQASPMAGMMN